MRGQGQFVQALKRLSWHREEKVMVLKDAVDNLDLPKSYVSDGQDQLRQDLGLGNVSGDERDRGMVE